MERRSQKRPVRSGTFIARTHLHTYKKECVVFVLSRRSNSSAFFVFSRCGIRRARIARDPRDATVARRRPRVVDDDFVFFSPLVFWTNWTREAYKCLQKSPRKERGKSIDDATLATRNARRRRKRANVAFASVPREGKKHGRVETTAGNYDAFFREINYFLLKCIHITVLVLTNSFHPLSHKTEKRTHQRDTKNELFNRDVRIALYPFTLRVDRYRRRDWLWRRHDVDGSLGGGKERHRRALCQGDVLGGVETSFGRARERLRGGGRTPIISSLMYCFIGPERVFLIT